MRKRLTTDMRQAKLYDMRPVQLTNDETTVAHLRERVEFVREVGHELLHVVRIQPAFRDPQDLLDPATWQSRCWAGYSDGMRLGVSACGYDPDANTEWGFHPLDQLANYFAAREADLNDCVIVEMLAYEADERDEDDGNGAVLVWPQRILSVTPVEETDLPKLLEALEADERTWRRWSQ